MSHFNVITEMDHNVLASIDDCIDPTIFNLIEVGSSAISPNLEEGVGFSWADDLISSAEHEPSNVHCVTSHAVGQPTTLSSLQPTQLVQGMPQQQMGGLHLLAMGQQQAVMSSGTGGVSAQQLLQNQTLIQGMGSKQLGSQFILKSNSGAHNNLQLGPTQTASSAHQFLPASLSRSSTPSQSPSPHPGVASINPSNQTFSLASGQLSSRPASQHQVAVGSVTVTAGTAMPSNFNFLQLSQPQISQQVPLQGFMTSQAPQQNSLLQGHALLASQGSNIVHTQNALIQNPNVVNVNVAHVLPNHVNLQGTLIQTPQGKFLIQTPTSGQQLSGQLNLSAISNLGQVQVANSVGLGQTVMAQPSGNVSLGSSGGTGGQSNFSLVNIGGPQGQQILIQRPCTTNVQASASAQGLILRTVPPTQQLVQQHLQTSSSNLSNAQVPQQMLTSTTNSTPTVQLQQLMTSGGTQSLHLVGHTAATPHSNGSGSVILQQVVPGNQQVRVIGQPGTQATSKPGTVTLNLSGQNINFQQLQNLGSMNATGLQLSQTVNNTQQQFLIQSQQPSLLTTHPAVHLPSSTVQAYAQPSVNNVDSSGLLFDNNNILSQAMMSSGIEPEDSLMDIFNSGMIVEEPLCSTTPSPPPSKNKKKKPKKKEEHPVVLSSTDLSTSKSGLSTASCTSVTTTISQSLVSLPGQSMQAAGTPTHVTIASAQTPITSASTISHQSGLLVNTSISSPSCSLATFSPVTTSSSGRGGKHGPPNVSVKPMNDVQLSLAEKNQLHKILSEISRLAAKSNRTEAENAMLQQLDMHKRKLLNPVHSQSQAPIKGLNPQEQPIQIQQSGLAQLTATSNRIVQSAALQKMHPTTDVKPTIGNMQIASSPTAGCAVLQMQTKSSTSAISPSATTPKFKFLPTKMEPKAVSASPPNIASETKPLVLGAGSTSKMPAGNMVMATHPSGSTSAATGSVVVSAGSQQGVLLQLSRTPASSQPVLVSPNKMATVVNPVSPTPQSITSMARPVQIKIANQILTLQLTPAQQQKLELHLSRMSFEQQTSFLSTQQTVLAKLQMHTASVMQQQTQISAVSKASNSQTGDNVVTEEIAAGQSGQQKQDNLPTTVQQALENSPVKTELTVNQSKILIKRAPDIPKATLIHQQLSKDQAHAVAADTVSTFKNNREACRRLLRFHVFQSHGPALEEFEKAEKDFESLSENLMEKMTLMLARGQQLMLQDSARGFPSAEMVFLQRMMNQDMHSILREEKVLGEKAPEAFVPMPLKYLQPSASDEGEEDSQLEDEGEDVLNEIDEGEDVFNEIDEGEDVLNGIDELGEDGEASADERVVDDKPDHCVSKNDGHPDQEIEIDDTNSEGEPPNDNSNVTSLQNSLSSSSVTDEDELQSSPSSPHPLDSSNSVPGRFRLVIRNDGKGFTSRLALERHHQSRISEFEYQDDQHIYQSQEKNMNRSSHQISKETKTEVIETKQSIGDLKRKKEYEERGMIDCTPQDKMNRTSLSVKLERLSERTSLEYGLGVKKESAKKSRRSVAESEREVKTKKEFSFTSDCLGQDSSMDDLTDCGVDVSNDSGQYVDKHKKVSMRSCEGVSVKIEACSGMKSISMMEESCRKRRHSQTCTTDQDSHIGSNTSKSVHKRDNHRKVPISLWTKVPVENCIGEMDCTENAGHTPSSRLSQHCDQSTLDLDEFVPENPTVDFPDHIPPCLMETGRMFNVGSDSEMETSLDTPDSQRSMMQHAIDSILNNGSTTSIEAFGHVIIKNSLSMVKEDVSDSDGTTESEEEEDESVVEDEHSQSHIASHSQELPVDDLDAAVQSILM